MGEMETRVAVLEDRVKRLETDVDDLRDDLKEQLREVKNMLTKLQESTSESIKGIANQLNKKVIWGLTALNGALLSLIVYLFAGHYRP